MAFAFLARLAELGLEPLAQFGSAGAMVLLALVPLLLRAARGMARRRDYRSADVPVGETASTCVPDI